MNMEKMVGSLKCSLTNMLSKIRTKILRSFLNELSLQRSSHMVCKKGISTFNFILFRLIILSFSFLILFQSCKETLPVYISQVETRTFYSKILEDSLHYNVYLPYASASGNVNNIIYLLHGHGGNHDDWFESDEGRIKSILDSLITKKLIPPVYAVSLDAGNSWYVDRQIKMESVYFNEFIPYMESSCNFDPKRINRIIAGNSAGGYGTLRFMLQAPELFDASILLSPAAYNPSPPMISSSRKINVFNKNNIFNDSIWNSYSYKVIPIRKDDSYPEIFISSGIDDKYGIPEVIDSLSIFFDNNNIAFNTALFPGGHEWELWREVFALNISKIFQDEMN